MSKYPVSIIPYANMAPYRAMGLAENCEFVENIPRQSTQALREGRVLAAPIPVGDLPDLEDQIDFLGPFGIASEGPVQSVLLFSRAGFDHLAAPACIHLTEHSSTSVKLLYLLSGYQHGFDRIAYETRDAERADGKLLIGDQALLFADKNQDYRITDLAEMWHKKTNLSMVFARWVIRKDAPVNCRKALETWLGAFEKNEQACVEQCIPIQAARLGVTNQRMLAYLKPMKRILGPKEIEGQAYFLRQLRRHGRSRWFMPRPSESRPS